MTKVLYPGSFDPITKGHMNIIEQASNLFDEVVIAVLQNPTKKNGLFTLEERLEIIKELYKNTDNIKVVTGNGAYQQKTAVPRGSHRRLTHGFRRKPQDRRS